MLLHNSHRHNVHCHALSADLEGFETREVDAELAQLVPCAECRCVVIDDQPAKPAAKKAAEPAE